MASIREFVCRCALVFFFVFLTLTQAQLNRGVIEGTVTDPQGLVVTYVTVAITAMETGVSFSSRTNQSGYYRALNLVPGKYRVHFVATGFSPLDIASVEVRAGEVVKIDARLKLGSTHQEISVAAQNPLVETDASNFSTALDTRTVDAMPLAGRDVQQLVYLIPGVNSVGGPPGSNFGFNSEYGSFPDPTHVLGSQLSVNGGQSGANAWYLDGNLNVSAFAENIVVDPSPDAVGEFQTITSALSAEYGRTGGGIFSVVLKSGTNKLHGNLYEFLRNDFTNAQNPFTSIDALGHHVKERQLRYNNFGGTVGGPVVIPHVYNGRNRTFFFFSMDVQRLRLLNSRGVFTVPTALMRQGNFSEDPGVLSNGLWNPFTTVGPDANGAFERVAFGTPQAGDPNGCFASHVEISGGQSCKFSTQIPVNLLDPTAAFFINTFPLPNYSDPLSNCPPSQDGFKICNNFRGSVGSSQNHLNLSLKVDHKASEKSNYFLEWLYNPVHYDNYRLPWTGPTFPEDSVGFGSNYPFYLSSQIIALGHNYVFRPTLVNAFRFSLSREYITTNPLHPYPDSVNQQSQVQALLAPLRIPLNQYFPTPNWSMSTPGGSFIGFGPTPWVNMTTAASSLTFLDNLTKVAGKHTIKTGLVYRLEHTAYKSAFPTVFFFDGSLAQDPNTGLGGTGLAQFMMGAVGNAGPQVNYTGVLWQPYERFSYWGFYGQDDVRVTPKLTINIGLRYDIFGLYSTRQSPLSNFCLTCPNTTTGLPGKVIYVGDPEWPGHGHTLAPANKNDLGPRINFAWTPWSNGKTILRGGYDILYSNAFSGINAPGQAASNAPGWNQEYDWTGSFYPNQCAPFSNQCVAFPLSDTTTDKASLTSPAVPSVFPAEQHASMIGIGFLQFFTPPVHDPIVQTWNLEIQRELPGKLAISVAYIGNHGTHLLGEPFRSYNYVHTKDVLKYQAALSSNVPITNYYSGQTAALLEQVYGSSTLPLSLLLKPYPFYGATSGASAITAFDGTTVYHGMNVRLQKKYSRGLDFIVAYTLAKKFNNASTADTSAFLVDPIHWTLRSSGIGGRAGDLGLGSGFFGAYQDPDNRKADRTVSADDIPQTLNIAATYELPFGRGRPLLNKNGVWNTLFGHWQLTANLNAQSGLPLAIRCPSDEITNRCNQIGDPHFSGSRSKQQKISQWINPAAFEPAFGSDPNFWANYTNLDPRAWQFGNMGPRISSLRSPGFWIVDTSLTREVHLAEERYFELRWEVFNAFNHPNLGLPGTNWCLPPNPDGSTDKVHLAGCSFGRITNVQTDPRAMEFALKFYW